MIANAITDQIAVTAHAGSLITAVSKASLRINQCIETSPTVTIPICNNSRVVRIISPFAWPPNIPFNIRLATVKSGARKKTQAIQTAP